MMQDTGGVSSCQPRHTTRALITFVAVFLIAYVAAIVRIVVRVSTDVIGPAAGLVGAALFALVCAWIFKRFVERQKGFSDCRIALIKQMENMPVGNGVGNSSVPKKKGPA